MKKTQNTRTRAKENLSKSQQRVLVRIVFALIMLGLVYTIFAPQTGLISYFLKRAQLKELEQKTALLEKENEKLAGEVSNILNDPKYLEEVARKEYGLLRKNETVYDFSPNSPKKEKKQ